MLYSADNLSESVFEDCFALHFCSVSLGDFPMKGAHIKAIELAKKNGAIISFAPNIRLPLWSDTDLLKSAIDEFLPMADIIKVSDEEIGFITGYPNIKDGCKQLLHTAKIVLCTCGAEGAYAYTDKSEIYVQSEKISAKDTTGAGDAFIGSFLYSLHHGQKRPEEITENELKSFVKASNNYCAKSVQKYGAIESYPTNI